ncbi:MAG: MoaD/ThiS family protein [Candidatus Rokubacteria bacterium]|nr:MoaD/ThiS family protein [Candidatus Rokubacteria bacterium]
MVAAGKGMVRLEIVPWLTQPFGKEGTSRVILDEEVDGAISLGDFLTSLVHKYPAIGVAIVDLDAGELFEHVNVVHNDTVVGSHTALKERIQAGDSLVFLPAFSGG